MPVKVYFGDFHVLVCEHQREIQQQDPEAYSPEWFLLRYLTRIMKATQGTAELWQVQSSINSLVRFYLDNIEQDSEHGRMCQSIYLAFRKTMKENRESG